MTASLGSTPELVIQILTALHDEVDCRGEAVCKAKSSLASCLRVCQSWYPLAVEVLWSQHAELHHYCATVADFTSDEDGIAKYNRTFDCIVEPSQTARWEQCARFTTDLTLASESRTFHPSALSEISVAMNTGPLFPSLTNISIGREWIDLSFAHLINLIPRGLKELTLELPAVLPPGFAIVSLLRLVSSRVDSLKTLNILSDIFYDTPRQRFTADLASLFPSLERLELPYSWITPSVMLSFSYLPSLTRLNGRNQGVIGDERRRDMMDIDIHNVRDVQILSNIKRNRAAFSGLDYVTLSGSLRFTGSLIRTAFAQSQVSKLGIWVGDFPENENPENSHAETFRTIAQTFKNLQCLYLSYSAGILHMDQFPDFPDFEPLHKAAFLPLTSCENLTELEINHPHHTAMSETEVMELVEFWPNLRFFQLCAFNTGFGASPAMILTLAVLEKLARKLTHLRRLNVTCNADTEHLQVNSVPDRVRNLHLRLDGSFNELFNPANQLDIQKAALYLNSWMDETCAFEAPYLVNQPRRPWLGGVERAMAYNSEMKNFERMFQMCRTTSSSVPSNKSS